MPLTAASGTLQAQLTSPRSPYTHRLRGKAGRPLSTGFVLSREMNRCGVGVGEAGRRERSRGSSRLGVPSLRPWGQGGAAWQRSPPGLDSALPPRRAAAALGGTTNPASAQLWRFRFVSLAAICPGVFAVPGSAPGSPPGCAGGEGLLWLRRTSDPSKATGARTQTSPAQHAALADPAGSGETKPDLSRGNKYIKSKGENQSAIWGGEGGGMPRVRALPHRKPAEKKPEASISSEISQSETCQ